MIKTDIEDFDVLIIGAGINGAGLFRDLCSQGLRCAIVDKGDYGSGTSAAPSRLIHGGLKYLETGEFRLVAESTYERNLLLRNASHLVKPLPTLIPIQSWTKGIWAAIRTFFGATTAPRSRGAVLIKLGLSLYDLYGTKARSMPRHQMLGRKRALQSLPALTPKIVAIGTYYDATITAPERLVWELVQDGLAAQPDALALNWATVLDQSNGVVAIADHRGVHHQLRPKIVINAAGPWIDQVNACLGLQTRLIGGTKGSHILLEHPELLRQLEGRMIYFEADDGRILLVFPYQGKVLVGSTDLPANGPDDVECETSEITYFFDSLRNLLPGLVFDTAQIIFTYSGIRPLPYSSGVAAGLISRDHSAPEHTADTTRPFPVISLVGGKWTTFRAFAQDVADTVLSNLGHARQISTAGLAIGGGRDMPTLDTKAAWIGKVAAKTGASPERVAVLLARYGTTAATLAAHEGPKFDRIAGTNDTSSAEIYWIARNEHVLCLGDVILRRTQLAISGQLNHAGLVQICAIVAQALGWQPDKAEAALNSTVALLETKHHLHLRQTTSA